MKILVYVIPVLLAVTVRADDITLADGKTVFHNAKIVSQDAASVTIRHSTGIARVTNPRRWSLASTGRDMPTRAANTEADMSCSGSRASLMIPPRRPNDPSNCVK
jgi:hypothetical protein